MPESVTPQDGTLAASLAALSSPTRLALLRALRTPKRLRDIVVKLADSDGGRPLSRQAIREHLDKLADLGFVSARTASEDADAAEFVVNHQKLFAVSEEFRLLGRIRPTAEPSNPTVAAGGAGGVSLPERPSLVLVKGPEEGQVFELAGSGQRWRIGRHRDVEVPLDFDPFVSGDHAAVSRQGEHFFVADLPDSRNGTWVNFRQIPKGEARPIAHGDLIGVGRSLLLFRLGRP